MKKALVSALMLMLALAIGMFWQAGPAAAAGKPVELNYSLFFPATHGHTLLATEWAREVEKRSDNAVKITIFPGATLTPARTRPTTGSSTASPTSGCRSWLTRRGGSR